MSCTGRIWPKSQPARRPRAAVGLVGCSCGGGPLAAARSARLHLSFGRPSCWWQTFERLPLGAVRVFNSHTRVVFSHKTKDCLFSAYRSAVGCRLDCRQGEQLTRRVISEWPVSERTNERTSERANVRPPRDGNFQSALYRPLEATARVETKARPEAGAGSFLLSCFRVAARFRFRFEFRARVQQPGRRHLAVDKQIPQKAANRERATGRPLDKSEATTTTTTRVTKWGHFVGRRSYNFRSHSRRLIKFNLLNHVCVEICCARARACVC